MGYQKVFYYASPIGVGNGLIHDYSDLRWNLKALRTNSNVSQNAMIDKYLNCQL